MSDDKIGSTVEWPRRSGYRGLEPVRSNANLWIGLAVLTWVPMAYTLASGMHGAFWCFAPPCTLFTYLALRDVFTR